MSENEGKDPKIYNPVTVTISEATGVVMLGILAITLLVALLRSQSRHRKLLAQLAGLESQQTEEQPQ